MQVAEQSEMLSLDAEHWRRVFALERGQPAHRTLIVKYQRGNRELLERMLRTVWISGRSGRQRGARR